MTDSLLVSFNMNTDDENVQFVNSISNSLKCVRCKNVAGKAFQLPCGHRLCESCFQFISTELETKESVPCPSEENNDCEPVTKDEGIVPDFAARREILNLKVFCPHKDYGCGEKMAWKKLQEHKRGCEYQPVQCRYPGCKQTVSQKAYDEHCQKCEYKPVKCGRCHKEVPGKDLKEHEEKECPEADITCPHGCKKPKTLKRKELAAHEVSCPYKPSDCPFSSVGCTFRGKAEALAAHEAGAVAAHLGLQLKETRRAQERERELQQTLLEMRALHEELRTGRDNLTQRYTSTVSRVEGVETTLMTKMESVDQLRTALAAAAARETALTVKVEEQGGRIEQLRAGPRDTDATVARGATSAGATAAGATSAGATSAGANMAPAAVSAIAELKKYTERQLGLHDVRLAEVDLRFQVLETSSHDGVLIWKIRDFKRRRQEATSNKIVSLYSQPFYTSRYGYKMCARVYLNGDGAGKNSHISLFFVIMRGEYDALLPWPFKQKVTLTLMDQVHGLRNLSDTFTPDALSSSFQKPTAEMNVASGCPKFVAHNILDNTYTRDDTIFIKIEVERTGLDSFA